jgi:hypothetical protein
VGVGVGGGGLQNSIWTCGGIGGKKYWQMCRLVFQHRHELQTLFHL